MKSYNNPGLSPEAIRAKHQLELRNKMFDKIFNATDRAFDVILDIAENGEKDADRLKAAQDLLNRAGMKQAHEITVTHDNRESAGDKLLSKLKGLRPPEDDNDEDIIDVEVLSDED